METDINTVLLGCIAVGVLIIVILQSFIFYGMATLKYAVPSVAQNYTGRHQRPQAPDHPPACMMSPSAREDAVTRGQVESPSSHLIDPNAIAKVFERSTRRDPIDNLFDDHDKVVGRTLKNESVELTFSGGIKREVDLDTFTVLTPKTNAKLHPDSRDNMTGKLSVEERSRANQDPRWARTPNLNAVNSINDMQGHVVITRPIHEENKT